MNSIGNTAGLEFDMVNLSRRQWLKLSAGALIGTGIAGSGYSSLIEPHRISVERVTAPIPRLPSRLDGFRIAVLSDFHLQPHTTLPHIEKATREANLLRPDLAVVLGDFVGATAEAIHELAPALAKLNARLGIYGVLGNHDYWKGAAIVQHALEKAGIPVLRNSGLTLSAHREELYLAGFESAWCGHPDANAALARRRHDSVPTIALIHEPDFADTLASDGRFALQLSGHSHGGQVRLPFVGALRLPSWGRKYDHGLYRVQEMALYTNRGIGVGSIPVRFNCPPEVTEITLRSA